MHWLVNMHWISINCLTRSRIHPRFYLPCISRVRTTSSIGVSFNWIFQTILTVWLLFGLDITPTRFSVLFLDKSQNVWLSISTKYLLWLEGCQLLNIWLHTVFQFHHLSVHPKPLACFRNPLLLEPFCFALSAAIVALNWTSLKIMKPLVYLLAYTLIHPFGRHKWTLKEVR